jgi:hypothetical protein
VSLNWGGKRRRQRGSAVLFIVAWLVFAILALGAWSLFEGQAGIARMQAQFQADSVAQGAGVVARVYGPELRCQAGYGLEYLEYLHQFNGGADGFVCPLIGNSPVVDPTATISFGLANQETQAAAGQFGGLMAYAGDAARQAHVTTIHEKDSPKYIKDRPNVVLMLDFSRSMLKPAFAGDTLSKIERLRSLITHVLDTLPIRPEYLGNANEQFVDNVDLGAIFFGGTVLTSIAIGPGESVKEAIRTRLNGVVAQQGNPVEEGTNYDAAFRGAAQLFANHNDGGLNTTVLITDGLPTKGGTPPTFDTPFADAKLAFEQAIKGPDANGQPLVQSAYTMFVGDVTAPVDDFNGVANNITQFIEAISDPGNADFTDDAETNFEAYFDDWLFYFSCRSGPINPQLEDFPIDETWVWVRQPNEFPGFPLEWVDDPFQIVGDFAEPAAARVGPDPDDAVQSLFYQVISSPDPNEPPDGIWVQYTEFICRKLEDEGHHLAVRHGWSSIVDSARAIPAFNVAMPALP